MHIVANQIGVVGRDQGNLLIHEKSPYLLQHAGNPVSWFPWGAEALEKATKEDKPIFLSIGYSTCHWCHVMAHESFEDLEIADFLNEHFISIKVDREECPGIDRVYMVATQRMIGAGGWPMSLFLLPDTRPFHTGTYYPPRAVLGQPGFLELLHALHKAWETERKDLTLEADQVTRWLRDEGMVQSIPLEKVWLERGCGLIADSYDPEYGGFSEAPKFPRPVVLDFLLRYSEGRGDKAARDMALFTLEKMAAGGMYDQIGGGVHRYSVDASWRVPHFEKMLYDQSQLAVVYLQAYQLSGDKRYRRTAAEILDYVLRDMQHPKGGFYSAEDADSVDPYAKNSRSEGAFYLWSAGELAGLLPGDQGAIFNAIYGVKDAGNALADPQQEFTGRNILYRARSLEAVAGERGLGVAAVADLLEGAREKVLQRRQEREAPRRDDKIITAWNGLMISALSKGAMVLGTDRYLFAANRATDFLLGHIFIEEKLKRRWCQGEARYSAGLEDYSFLVQGLLDLYEAGQEPSRLRQALLLTEKMMASLSDPKGGFYESARSEQLLVRLKGAYDGAEPAGNSVAAMNLLRLGRLTGEGMWAERGRECIESFGKTLAAYPPAMLMMLSAMLLQSRGLA